MPQYNDETNKSIPEENIVRKIQEKYRNKL